MSIARRRAASRQRELRDSLWAEADGNVWPLDNQKGFAQVPRTLPLLLRLMRDKRLSGNKDPGGVYIDLLSRNREGLVELDEVECSYGAGVAIRTWRDRIRLLARLGFLRVFPRGPRELGYAVIVHPHIVVTELARALELEPVWLAMYEQVRKESGSSEPEQTAEDDDEDEDDEDDEDEDV